MIPYGDFHFFLLLAVFLLPAIVLGFIGRGLHWYSLAASVVFVWLIFRSNRAELISVGVYVVYQWILVWLNLHFSKRTWFYRLSLLLSLLPLLAVKGVPFLHIKTTIGFLGISYLTFKSVQLIIEIRDKLIKQVKPYQLLHFLLFFPTISAGPIDRYRRFVQDTQEKRTGKSYSLDLFFGIHRLFQGFLYKFIIAYLIAKYWLPLSFLTNISVTAALNHWYYQHFYFIPTFVQFKSIIANLLYMYAYSFYLFFDFAGYTAFAVGVSYILGIHTPENFNKPFVSRNIKDFWNRWHMSLSYWFRDYVYMRLVIAIRRKKLIKNRWVISALGYLALFGLMGLWHGVQLHFIVYGLYHACLLILFELWELLKKRYRFWGDNFLVHGVSIFFTFQFVCFGFLIFSGHLF